MIAQLTLKSGNNKTGPIPASMTEPKSCPTSCPWRDKGCYAKYGPLAMHWPKVVDRGDAWRTFCDKIASLPIGQIWRHNQAGDLPGTGNRIDARKLRALVNANRMRSGYTYTHKPVLGNSETTRHNRACIADANARGFRVNLSADNLAQADDLADLRIGPVVTIVASDAPAKQTTPKGRAVILCPAQATYGVTCASCKLCARDRSAIVAFRAHGAASKHVSDRVR